MSQARTKRSLGKGPGGRLETLSFVGPTIVLSAIFVVYPVVYLLYGSLFSWSGVGAMKFVGLSNYVRLFTNDWIFNTAMKNEVIWALLTIFPQMILGFILAVCLNKPIPGRTFYRTVIYMPAVLSSVVIGIIWQSIYDPYMGVLGEFLRRCGLGSLVQPWLADPKTALRAVILVNVWQWTGWSMLLYLAGLQSIPDEVYEAATIDGATEFQQVYKISWPLVSGTSFTLILLGIIGTLQTFALVYVLTKGGPNHASELLTTHIFTQAFTLRDMGYASAISVVLLAVGVAASSLQLKMRRAE